MISMQKEGGSLLGSWPSVHRVLHGNSPVLWGWVVWILHVCYIGSVSNYACLCVSD